MSRTYKDQPDWVKAQKTGHKKIRHHYRCEDNPNTWQFTSTRKEKIVTEPHWHLVDVYKTDYLPSLRRSFRYKYGKKWVYTSTEEIVEVEYTVGKDKPCDLDLEHNTGKRCGFWYSPPEGTKWWYNKVGQYERKHYDRQERTYTRDKMKRAKDDYNVNGDTDIEPGTRRNPSGLYGGGYYW